MPPPKIQWDITQDAFDQLLARLDPDRERAAEKYEELRQMLITFFEFRNLPDPEEQADETINRVARQLSSGKEIYTGSPSTYFIAVARNVWRESLAQNHPANTSLDDLLPAQTPNVNPHETMQREAELQAEERRLECLKRCLQALPEEQRTLLREYYQGEKDEKIKRRKRLAAQLGIPLNALRIRACRLRDKIEACIRREWSE
ncbi:MAG TPA: sigma-70 family RNA polymerase sigma factor [Blastocatellia bacterium]|nr:sigma-70 family RNA polymerase sigma factor [Blastocatellia bacterium]